MQKMKKPSASSRAMANAVVGVGYTVIGVVVLFFDVMTIKLLWSRFPDGLFRYSAVAGILATGVTIIALVVGKSHWFRPGGQMNWAWFMTFAELIVSVLNVIAAFNPDGFAWWLLIMPATPVLAVVTWILMIFFSPDTAQVHAQMEMEDEQQKAQLDYQKAEHDAHMQLKHSFLGQFQNFLQEETNSPENLAILRQAAARLGKNVISGLIGSPIAMQGSQFVMPEQQAQPQLPPAKEVTGHLQATQSPRPFTDEERRRFPQMSALQDEYLKSGTTQSFSDWMTTRTPVLHDKEDYLSLLDKAVKYGQISDEKAQPLRDMIRATSPLAQPASLHQNGHVTPEQPKE